MPGRSRHRPLGDGRLVRHAARVQQNVDLEYERNGERYEFLRWGQSAFDNFRVVPPGTGICHQVNLEYLAQTVWTRRTTTGDDDRLSRHAGRHRLAHHDGQRPRACSAGASAASRPRRRCSASRSSMLIPEVVGFKLTGKLHRGHHRDRPRAHRHRDAAQEGRGRQVRRVLRPRPRLPVARRPARRSPTWRPEYGATCGFFPVDADTLAYLETLRPRCRGAVALVEAYSKAQGLFRTTESRRPACSPTRSSSTSRRSVPSLAGPKRPQDRVAAGRRRRRSFADAGRRPRLQGARRRRVARRSVRRRTALRPRERPSGSATATWSSPPSPRAPTPRTRRCCSRRASLARKARARGPHGQAVGQDLAGARLAGGHRLSQRAGLRRDLDALGFNLVGYGCTTCIGNSGPLPRRDLAVHQRERPRGGLGAVGQPQFRGPRRTPTCAPTTSRRRRWWWPTR